MKKGGARGEKEVGKGSAVGAVSGHGWREGVQRVGG